MNECLLSLRKLLSVCVQNNKITKRVETKFTRINVK